MDSAFLEALDDGIILLDNKQVITYVNQAMLNMLGGRRGDLLGGPIYERLIIQNGGSTLKPEEMPFGKVLEHRQPIVIEQSAAFRYVLVRRDRTLLPIEMTVLPLSDQEPNVAAVIVHDANDINQIDSAKNEFIAMISHQLRTPLNVISWYVEKLKTERHGELNEKQKEYLTQIYDNNTKLVELVQAVVNVSRTDLARLKRKHEQVRLDEVVTSLSRRIRKEARLQGVNFHLSLDKSKSYVLEDSDREHAEVIVKNLLANAVHYSAKGDAVEVKLLERLPGSFPGSRDRRGVVLEVRDTGSGIPDEEQSHVFDRLYRGANGKSLHVNGIGLGLYLSKRFIEALGGEIWFESQLYEGSTFWAFFPNGQETEALAEQQQDSV